MIKILLIKLSLLFCLTASFITQVTVQAESNDFENEAWRLVKEEDGVSVFTRTTTSSSLRSTKGVVVIPASMNHLLTVLENPKTFTRWMYNCKSASTLKQVSFVERYDYVLADMPFFAWDRDLIVQSVLRQNQETKQVVITFTAAPNFIPEKRGVVRIKKMTGRMILTPLKQKSGEKEQVQLVYEVNAYPGGLVPKWVINDLAFDYPFFSLKKLRDEIVNGLK